MSLATYHDERPLQPRRYRKPAQVDAAKLSDLLRLGGHAAVDERQLDLLRDAKGRDVEIYLAGDRSLLTQRRVAIVGARDVSEAGKSRAYKLARELVSFGIVIVSGLARGVDSAAHFGAIQNNGRTIAVIGTPLSKAYPAENAGLQEDIYENHLLMSPFAEGTQTFRSSFPKRNRVMALLSDATVIVEASDTSGSLHQAAECLRSGRWLFIMKSVIDNPDLNWPSKFLGKPKVAVLSSTREIVDAIAV